MANCRRHRRLQTRPRSDVWRGVGLQTDMSLQTASVITSAVLRPSRLSSVTISVSASSDIWTNSSIRRCLLVLRDEMVISTYSSTRSPRPLANFRISSFWWLKSGLGDGKDSYQNGQHVRKTLSQVFACAITKRHPFSYVICGDLAGNVGFYSPAENICLATVDCVSGVDPAAVPLLAKKPVDVVPRIEKQADESYEREKPSRRPRGSRLAPGGARDSEKINPTNKQTRTTRLA